VFKVPSEFSGVESLARCMAFMLHPNVTMR
jgi:hypothetical protein